MGGYDYLPTLLVSLCIFMQLPRVQPQVGVGVHLGVCTLFEQLNRANATTHAKLCSLCWCNIKSCLINIKITVIQNHIVPTILLWNQTKWTQPQTIHVMEYGSQQYNSLMFFYHAGMFITA